MATRTRRTSRRRPVGPRLGCTSQRTRCRRRTGSRPGKRLRSRTSAAARSTASWRPCVAPATRSATTCRSSASPAVNARSSSRPTCNTPDDGITGQQRDAEHDPNASFPQQRVRHRGRVDVVESYRVRSSRRCVPRNRPRAAPARPAGLLLRSRRRRWPRARVTSRRATEPRRCPRRGSRPLAGAVRSTAPRCRADRAPSPSALGGRRAGPRLRSPTRAAPARAYDRGFAAQMRRQCQSHQ